MAKEDSRETLLARWLEGTLSDKEREQLEQEEGFDTLQTLARKWADLPIPAFLKEKIRDQIKQQEEPVPAGRMTIMWPWSIATGIALILAAGFWYFQRDAAMVVVENGPGAPESLELPDGSQVRLNATSKLEYNKKTWGDQRLVQLEGEAWFDVEDGSSFEVQTPLGAVRVLGTTFNVRQRYQSLEVSCYSGRVQVEGSGQKTELQEGEIATLQNGDLVIQTEEKEAPFWFGGESVFDAVPYFRVISELEAQYGVEIKIHLPPNEKIKPYTGEFPQDDLVQSLKNVTEPYGYKVIRRKEGYYEINLN